MRKPQAQNPSSNSNDVFFVITWNGKVKVIPRTTRKGLAQRRTECQKAKYGYLEAVSRDMRWMLINWLRSIYGHWRLAEMLGISRGTLQSWISRRKHPSNENLAKIIQLGIQTDKELTIKALFEDLAESFLDFLEKYKEELRELAKKSVNVKGFSERLKEIIEEIIG